MFKLQVYISDDCWSCEETERIVADVAPKFPGIQIEVLNTGENMMPESVFAVPTYMLNGHVIYLGNPTRDELCAKLSLFIQAGGSQII